MLACNKGLNVVASAGVVTFWFRFCKKEKDRSGELVCKKKKKVNKGPSSKTSFEDVVPDLKVGRKKGSQMSKIKH